MYNHDLHAQITCHGNEMSYKKTPISIHKKTKLPEAFVSKECKIEREFGKPYERVYYLNTNLKILNLNN